MRAPRPKRVRVIDRRLVGWNPAANNATRNAWSTEFRLATWIALTSALIFAWQTSNGFAFGGTPCAPVTNDTCATAAAIGGTSGSLAIDIRAALPGQPAGSCNVGAMELQNDAWFAWTAPVDLVCQFTVSGLGLEAIAALYEGASCAALSESACAHMTGSGSGARFRFRAQMGATYYVQVGDAGALPGSEPGYLFWSCAPCGDFIVEPVEECDDGNATSSDGCDDLCQVEHDAESCTSAIELDGSLPINLVHAHQVGNNGPAGICGPSLLYPFSPQMQGWYDVIGTGNTMTVTTCRPGTNIDTIIQVFCGGCGGLQCVGGNDDQPGPFDPACDVEGDGTNRGSTFSWCSAPGETYHVLVGTDYGVLNRFSEIEVLDDGTPCGSSTNCAPPACGNGAVELGEQCDDGGVSPGDGCDAYCRIEVPNELCATATEVLAVPFVDTFDNSYAETNVYEPCGDTLRHDVWYRWTIPLGCDNPYAQFVPYQHDSIRYDGPDCANLLFRGHSSSSVTTVSFFGTDPGTTGWVRVGPRMGPVGPTTVLFDCSVCGDGIVTPIEECDDANLINNDGCSATCQLDGACCLPDGGCVDTVSPVDCLSTLDGNFEGGATLCGQVFCPVCGDSAIEGIEQCDDGNTLNGDGCDDHCRVEIVEPTCFVPADCRFDPPNNACNCAPCIGMQCIYSCTKYGNVNCDAGHLVNLDDLLCALAGFASIQNCPNGDIEPCGGNGILNLDDILRVLQAFAGNDPCGCQHDGTAPLCGSVSP